MKKLNSNNRIFEENQSPNGLHQHNSGAFTHREITAGVSQGPQSTKNGNNHGSANQIHQLASGQKLHILNQHLVS